MTNPELQSLQVEIDAYFQGHYDARQLKGEAVVAQEQARVWRYIAKDMERRMQWCAIAAVLEFALLICCAFYIAVHPS